MAFELWVSGSVVIVAAAAARKADLPAQYPIALAASVEERVSLIDGRSSAS